MSPINGTASTRYGKVYERAALAEARLRGLPWERRMRAGEQADLLDTEGCLPGGWLVGFKGVRQRRLTPERRAQAAELLLRGAPVARVLEVLGGGDRLSEAADQSERAMRNLSESGFDPAGIVPVQVIARPGMPITRHYAMTEYHYLLDLATERGGWAE